VSTEARAHVIVKGLVQGVFFRAFTREVASSLGLKGWVRNLWDGSVEAVLEGPKDRIELALERLKEGPPSARVQELQCQWEAPKGEFSDFSIRY